MLFEKNDQTDKFIFLPYLEAKIGWGKNAVTEWKESTEFHFIRPCISVPSILPACIPPIPTQSHAD
jgi:hypothetical protein